MTLETLPHCYLQHVHGLQDPHRPLVFLISSLTKSGQEVQLTSRIPSGLKVLRSAGFLLHNTHILWTSGTESDPAYEVGQYLNPATPPQPIPNTFGSSASGFSVSESSSSYKTKNLQD